MTVLLTRGFFPHKSCFQDLDLLWQSWSTRQISHLEDLRVTVSPQGMAGGSKEHTKQNLFITVPPSCCVGFFSCFYQLSIRALEEREYRGKE
jgi:hypothetical protein